MKSDDALAAEQSLEAKLSEIGVGRDRIDMREEAAPEPGTPAETVQADEQPRNELGQFADTEPEAEAIEPQAETEEHEDPAVAAYLEKYGGDVDKAIAAAVHAQRQLGKQSSEVGDLRAENAQMQELIGELQGLRSDFQQQRQSQPLDQATVDWFDEQVAMNPYGAAEYARQQGNNMLLQRALTNWKDMDPYAASVYTNELRLQEQQRQFQEQISRAQQLPMDSTINIALTNARSRHPEFSNYDDVIGDTLNRYPAVQEALQAAATAGDTGKLEAVIETAYALAKGDTLDQIVRTGSTPAETTTTSEVVAPTVSESHEETEAPTPTSQFRDAFRQEMEQRRRGVFVAE